jgi:hypothetical protein
MAGDLFNLVISATVMMSVLAFVAAVIAGSRADKVREWEEVSDFYRGVQVSPTAYANSESSRIKQRIRRMPPL